jgi:hypothetical protein
MGKLTQLFSIDELDALDHKHIAILRDALITEIQTSPEIQNILGTKLRPLYDRFKAQAAPQPSQGSRSPAARRPRSGGSGSSG